MGSVLIEFVCNGDQLGMIESPVVPGVGEHVELKGAVFTVAYRHWMLTPKSRCPMQVSLILAGPNAL